MTPGPDDLPHLERAIALAEHGRGRVSPNPVVGALVVGRDGTVLGEGWHAVFGGDHAEVAALRAAGDAARGATLYVSLEPCAHQGKTPPCTEAIVAAGIARVVVGADDPSRKAAGRGLGILRDEGVAVDVAGGDLAERSRAANQPFRKHARTGRPWVLMKSAVSLDGKVATAGGDSKWISGEAARREAHRWRAELDAVAVGIGTALADDPQLTARIEDAPRQPRRVVFDSLARLPLDSQLVAAAPEIPLTVVTSRAAPRAPLLSLENAGADVVVAVGGTPPDQVRSALDQLGDQGITSVLLEGGPRLAGAFMDAGEVDELRLFVAPIVLGSRTARDPFEGVGVDLVGDAVRALTVECDRVEDDLLVTARFKVW